MNRRSHSKEAELTPYKGGIGKSNTNVQQSRETMNFNPYKSQERDEMMNINRNNLQINNDFDLESKMDNYFDQKIQMK